MVNWTVYFKPFAHGSASSREQELGANFDDLHNIECLLRREGYHVIHEKTPGFLWIFAPEWPATAGGPGQPQALNQVSGLANEYGLKGSSPMCLYQTTADRETEVLTGSLRAQKGDRAFAIGIHQTNTNKRKRAPSEGSNNGAEALVNDNAEIRPNSPAQIAELQSALNPKSMHGRFLSSISQSFMYSLAIERLGVPLFEPEPALFAESNVQFLATTSHGGFPSVLRDEDLYTLKLHWLPSGTLLATACKGAGHSSALRFAISREKSRFVRVAPYGLIGEISGEATQFQQDKQRSEDASSGQIEGARSFGREEARALLTRIGFQIHTRSNWIKVYLHPHDGVFTHEAEIEWPDWLCIPIDRSREDVVCLPYDVDVAFDPLDRIQFWYNQRETRHSWLKQEKQKIAQAKQTHSAEPTEEQDTNVDINARKSLQELQSVAGIYPTPPDGNKLQPSSHGEDAADGKRPDTHNDMTTPAEHADDPQLALSGTSDDGTKAENYYHLQDDELFSDIHQNMESHNGVTEDDFDFFDEPDTPVVPKQEKPPDDSLVPYHETERQLAEESKDDVTQLQSQMTSPVGDQPERSSQQDLQQSRVEANHMPAPPIAHQLQDHKPDDTSKRQSQTDTERPVFSVRKSPPPLDSKYIQSGKFSAKTSTQLPYESRPSELPEIEKVVPKLDRVGAPSSESEETTNSENSLDLEELPASSPEMQLSVLASSGSPFQDNMRQSGKEAVAEEVLNDSSRIPTSREETSLAALLSEWRPESRMAPTKGTKLHADAEEMRLMPKMTEQQVVQVAQIIADQTVHYEKLMSPPEHPLTPRNNYRKVTDHPLSKLMSMHFEDSTRCTLGEVSELEHVQNLKSTPKSNAHSQSKEPEGSLSRIDSGLPGSTVKLPMLDFRIKRGDMTIDISPAALSFWEELGLNPRHGGKDVTAFCFCPDMEIWRQGARSFLEKLSHAYRSLRLGSFDVGHPAIESLSSGTASYGPMADEDDLNTPEVEAYCTKLGSFAFLSLTASLMISFL